MYFARVDHQRIAVNHGCFPEISPFWSREKTQEPVGWDEVPTFISWRLKPAGIWEFRPRGLIFLRPQWCLFYHVLSLFFQLRLFTIQTKFYHTPIKYSLNCVICSSFRSTQVCFALPNQKGSFLSPTSKDTTSSGKSTYNCHPIIQHWSELSSNYPIYIYIYICINYL